MIGPSQNFIDVRKHDTTNFPQDRSIPTTLSYQEQIYARVMMDYNSKVVKGASKPILVNLLAKAAEQIKDSVRYFFFVPTI